MSDDQRPICVLLCALGGEGGGVLAEWLVDAARRAGYPVQATSIPGVAQRTGATTYYVEVFAQPLAALGGRKPVLGLVPVPGTLDLLVSSELLETARQIGNGMSDAGRTCVVSSTARTLTTNERMQLGDGRVDANALIDIVRSHSREHHLLDMAALTQQAGTVVSAVMFGAVAASGVLPLRREDCEAVIREGGRGAEASLRGFALGHDRIAAARARVAYTRDVLADAAPAGPPRDADNGRATSASDGAPQALPAAVADRFPAAAHDLLRLGHARLIDYQDAAYADLYLDRLSRVAEAERSADPAAAGEVTREMARWLALWMAFDDIVRVADLKCRAARRDRVRREVKAGDGDLLRVHDHFKPGVPEIAALLPERLAGALTRWDARRQARGAAPWALPLKVASHGVFGLLALRVLAGLRGLRRRGSRWAHEQALIERWLQAVVQGTCDDAALGLELARCGQLIKGYGSTNERGKANLLHVVDQLAAAVPFATPALRAEAIRAARTAALADDSGIALDRSLQPHGAAARPLREVPIRFVRPPKARPRTG